MNAEKLINYVKRFRNLEARKKDLEHDYNVLCREVRSEYPDGARGDAMFDKFLETEFQLGAYERREFLLRAVTANVVPDKETLKRIGGFRSVVHVIALSKKEQIEVLKTVTSSNKSIVTVMRERGHYATPKKGPSDAEVLAQFVVDRCRNLPDNIREIVERQLKGVKKVSTLKIAA